MHKMPMLMLNVPLAPEADPLASAQVSDAVIEAEKLLSGRGRVLLRASGTEPLIRVMVEGDDAMLVDQLTRKIADTVAASA